MTTFRIVVAYPLLTEAQADEGNALALQHRLSLRGKACSVEIVDAGSLPPADVVLIGGLDEGDLAGLVARLDGGGIRQHVRSGGLVLAVNGGFVVLGERFEDASGRERDGLGLLPVRFSRGREITRPVVARSTLSGVPELSAYESHCSIPSAVPEGQAFAVHTSPAVVTDGAVAGKVFGTFLHGPLLARNAGLADALIVRASGVALPDAPGGWAEKVRQGRGAQDRLDPTGWAGMRYGRSLRRR